MYKNICCVPSSEPSQRDSSDEGSQHMVLMRNKKNYPRKSSNTPSCLELCYRIYPAIRRGFCPSRMTLNNKISPMKFCYNTNFTLPKQYQRSRSIFQDGSRSLGLF